MTFRSFHLRRSRALDEVARLRFYGHEPTLKRRLGVWVVAVHVAARG